MISGWWDRYRGIPYERNGCSRQGCGCWGLVALIYREQLGVELPAYTCLANTSDHIAYETAIGLKPSLWFEVSSPREFDVVLFRVGRLFHSGVLFSPRDGRFLHVCKDVSVTVESYKDLMWRHRLAGIWRHPDA